MQGMMRDGALFQLPPLGHTTPGGAGSVSHGSGRRLMWPTPRAMPEGRSFNCQFLNLTMAAYVPQFCVRRCGAVRASRRQNILAFSEWQRKHAAQDCYADLSVSVTRSNIAKDRGQKSVLVEGGDVAGVSARLDLPVL